MDVNNLFQQPGLFTFNANVTNNAVASFLLGYVQNFAQASGQFLDLRGKFFGFYAQDSWKVTRRLTLGYGVRYEPFIPWHEQQGRMGSFFPTLYAARHPSQRSIRWLLLGFSSLEMQASIAMESRISTATLCRGSASPGTSSAMARPVSAAEPVISMTAA